MGALPKGELTRAVALAGSLAAAISLGCGGGGAAGGAAPGPVAATSAAASTGARGSAGGGSAGAAAGDRAGDGSGGARARPGRPEVVAAEAMVDAMSSGNFAAALEHVDAKVRETTLTEAELRSAWESTVHDVGGFRGMDEVGATTGLGFTTVQVRCKGALAAFEVRVSFNAEHEGAPVASAVTIGHAWDPPPWADASRYREEGAAVESGGTPLAATLVVPSTPAAGGAPAVVLLQDGKSADRDDTVGGTKVMRDLAWGLALRGIVSVRFERRAVEPQATASGTGTGPATGRAKASPKPKPRTKTKTPSAADDVDAAVALLRRTPGVDPKRVAVVARGDAAAPAAGCAAHDAKLAGLVLVAAPPPDHKTAAALRKARAPLALVLVPHDADAGGDAAPKRWSRALAGRPHVAATTCVSCNHWLADAAVVPGRAANVTPAAVEAVAAALTAFAPAK